MSRVVKGSVSVIDMVADLKKGNLCPVELVEKTFADIKSSDPTIFTELLEERALREAYASRKRHREGNLLSAWDGIPVAWKDLFDIEGRVTTAGSVVLKSNAPATRDANMVANASQAGLISIGCLNMTEFAYSALVSTLTLAHPKTHTLLTLIAFLVALPQVAESLSPADWCHLLSVATLAAQYVFLLD